MEITFGICASPNGNLDYLENLIYSIKDSYEYAALPEDKMEIIVSGSVPDNRKIKGVIYLEFDESIKPGWITKKKNDIVRKANYKNVVLLHDYYMLDDFWWKGFRSFEKNYPDWKIAMNMVINFEGYRHSDWLVNQKYMDELLKKHPELIDELNQIAPYENGPRWVSGIPYEVNDLSHIQYISGGYIVAKKSVLLDFPLDENLLWGDAEDIEWSERVISKGYTFTLNIYCMNFLQKTGKWHLYQMSNNALECLRKMYAEPKDENDMLKIGVVINAQ